MTLRNVITALSAVLALLAFAPSTVSAPPYVPPYTFVLPTLKSPPPYPTKPRIVYEVTAYTAGYESTGKRRGDPLYGITASGKQVVADVTAACSAEIPFGTQLTIEGVGRRTCTDRGGLITAGKIDVYIADLKTAQDFGRQRLAVTITKIGSDVR